MTKRAMAVVVLCGVLASAVGAAPSAIVIEPGETEVALPQHSEAPPRRPDASPQPMPRTASPAEPATERRPSGNPLWAIPLRELTATRERPLFAPSRRAPSRAVASAPPAPPPPKRAEPEKPQLALVGTIAGGRGNGIGIFLDAPSKSVFRLRTGEHHKGWTLRAVRPGEVTLERGRQKLTLVMPPPEAGKTPAASPPPSSGNRATAMPDPAAAARASAQGGGASPKPVAAPATPRPGAAGEQPRGIPPEIAAAAATFPAPQIATPVFNPIRSPIPAALQRK